MFLDWMTSARPDSKVNLPQVDYLEEQEVILPTTDCTQNRVFHSTTRKKIG